MARMWLIPLLLICHLGFRRSTASAMTLTMRHPGQIPPLPPENLATLLERRASTDNNSVALLPSPPSTAPSAPPAPAPTPMDLSVSYALSTSCLSYLSSTLSSPMFLSCLPFSLLLTTSTSYASLLSNTKSSGSYDTLNSLLAYTNNPQPSAEQCDAYMAQVFQDVDDKKACGADIRGTPPVAAALEAWTGIGNYQVMREAAGLLDPQTGKYCYLEAVASSRPDDLYLWSLQAGIPLPATSRPTCSKCSSLLLTHYSESLNGTNALNSTIISQGIQMVNQACGSALVTYSATSPTSGARLVLAPASWTLLVAAFAILAFIR